MVKEADVQQRVRGFHQRCPRQRFALSARATIKEIPQGAIREAKRGGGLEKAEDGFGDAGVKGH